MKCLITIHNILLKECVFSIRGGWTDGIGGTGCLVAVSGNRGTVVYNREF